MNKQASGHIYVRGCGTRVEADDTVWSDYLECYVDFFYFYDDSYYYYYDNPVSISVSSDMPLTACYYSKPRRKTAIKRKQPSPLFYGYQLPPESLV